MSKQKHNISVDSEVIAWLDAERAVPNLPLSTIINMKLRKLMLAEARRPVVPAATLERTFILNEETGETKGVEITARASTVAPPAPTRYKRSVQKKERTA